MTDGPDVADRPANGGGERGEGATAVAAGSFLRIESMVAIPLKSWSLSGSTRPSIKLEDEDKHVAKIRLQELPSVSSVDTSSAEKVVVEGEHVYQPSHGIALSIDEGERAPGAITSNDA